MGNGRRDILAGGILLTAHDTGLIGGTGNGSLGVIGSNPHGNVSSTSVNHVAGIKKPPPWVKTPRRRGGKKTVTAVVEGNTNGKGGATVSVGNGHGT